MAAGRAYAALAMAGWFLWGAVLASAQSMSDTPAPQQMMPSGMPAPYPTTATPPSQFPTAPTQPFGPALAAMDGTAGGLATPAGAPGAIIVPLDATDPAMGPCGGLDAASPAHPLDPDPYMERSLAGDEAMSWQLVPTGLMYRSYLAGLREPRFGSQWVHVRDQGWRWDATLGARVGLLRYGTDNDLCPQGWQLDVEGAAFPRLNLERQRDLDDVDFRAGVPITTRQGPFEMKFGYYHLSSHLGDEFMLHNPDIPRINYVRENLVLGMAVYLNPALRLYSEVGYAFYTDGGAQPWEFQFGADFCSIEPTGPAGGPFFAINGHLRQENDFGGNLSVQTGWEWRGRSSHLLRVGLQYFNGMSDQYQFFNTFEEQIGAGLWYDF